MNRSDLVKMVANQQAPAINAAAKTPVLPAQVEQLVADIVNGFLDAISLTLACDEPVVLYGFGRFEPQNRRAEVKKNPATGEPMSIPARKTVGFAPSDPLKRRVNGR